MASVYHLKMVDSVSGMRFHRHLFWVLILALVLSQTLALAHQHAHDSPSSHDCALCLYAQHFANGLPSSTVNLAVTLSAISVVAASVCSLISVTSLSFLSRAPPVALQ